MIAVDGLVPNNCGISSETCAFWLDMLVSSPFLFILMFAGLKISVVQPFFRNQMENSSLMPYQTLGISIPKSLLFGSGEQESS